MRNPLHSNQWYLTLKDLDQIKYPLEGRLLYFNDNLESLGLGRGAERIIGGENLIKLKVMGNQAIGGNLGGKWRAGTVSAASPTFALRP